MNVHVLQHVPFEGLGSMEPWLRGRGADVGFTRFFESPALPDPAGLDLVIAMGGPMSVNDEAILPWLVEEKRFLHKAIVRGIPILGVCLGAQLIASALGARVRPAGQREIGWFDIESVPSSDDAFRFPNRARVLHWHGETFDLPPGATRLARSAACENQAFQIGGRVIGLQFHTEATSESVRALVEHCREDLVPGEFVQAAETILSLPAEEYARLETLTGNLLAHLTRDRH